MINILVVLQVWGQAWTGKHINLYVDNLAVVTVCQSGFTRDPTLAGYIRNIWLQTSIHNIKLRVHHIPGYRNVTADLLSRWEKSEKCNLKLAELVKNPEWRDVCDSYFKVNYEI